jgi:hypothetical protein
MSDVATAILSTFGTTGEATVDASLRASIEVVLQHIETAGMVVVPVSPLTATDYEVFSQTILGLMTPSLDTTLVQDLDTQDFHADAIIQALRSKGWFILPPP